jgi:long-subunit fatty acid transport protein
LVSRQPTADSRPRQIILALIVLGALAPSTARAWPSLTTRPIPNSIAGAADPHPAALFYNPAALAPLHGVHLWWDAGAGVQLGTIRRDAGEAAQAGQSTPITGPSVNGFLGATWDFFSDRVTAGIATMTPYNDLTQYPTGSAVRYQSIWNRAATLVQIVAVGVRISSRFFIGAGATFNESWIDYRFARDLAPSNGTPGIDRPSALCAGAPCGLENPLATQNVRLRGFGWGAGLTAGILVRPVDRVWLALSYFSRPFSPFHGDESDTGAEVNGAPGSPGSGCVGPCIGHAFANVVVPDVIHFAVRVEATPRLEIEGTARWVHYGYRSQLDVFLQGGTLDRIGQADPSAKVPAQLRFDRGWQDAYAFGASLRMKIHDRLRLSPSLIYESSAIDYAYINAANLDGHKADLALTLEWKPREHLTVGAHIGGTAYFVGHAGGAFDPRAEATCVDARYDLGACQKQIDGSAGPSAAGRYAMGNLHAGFALGMDY